MSFSRVLSQVIHHGLVIVSVSHVVLVTKEGFTICKIAEAVQRAAIIAEAEGMDKIEATHLERILPQLLLDF